MPYMVNVPHHGHLPYYHVIHLFQIRRILGQVIIAMAHHHYLSLEGGHLMVEFIVRQSAINTEDKVR